MADANVGNLHNMNNENEYGIASDSSKVGSTGNRDLMRRPGRSVEQRVENRDRGRQKSDRSDTQPAFSGDLTQTHYALVSTGTTDIVLRSILR